MRLAVSSRLTACLRARPGIRAVPLLLLGAVMLTAATPGECRLLKKRGKKAEAETCFIALTRSRSPFERAEGLWGLKQYSDASKQFEAAVKLNPKDPAPHTRWGLLFLERFNKEEAAKELQAALEIDKKYAPALLGLARVAADGFEKKAVELANQALEADPKLVEAHELLANLALEDADTKKAAEEVNKALGLSKEAFDANAVLAAIEVLADRPGGPHLEKVWAANPYYGEAEAIVAHHLVLNRRYEEGIAHYREAIKRDPEHWAARSELGINLMRLGREADARRELELCYDNEYRDSATVNTLRLIDSYKNFKTYETSTTIVKLHKKESDLLRIYFEDELKKAIAVYEKKYKMKLPGPVQLEVYPDHADFAVRTTGMPGLGALGVTFGSVVAMDSPSGRKPGTFHWASTLWHELSHVFVLTATHHRVPRWFTEGMAVHEETAAAPDWGDRVTPDVLMAIKDKKLLPLAQLDRGFVRPSYPGQVIISYFQAGRICDFIDRKWGYDKLLSMMKAFGERKTTEQVVNEVLGMKPEDFDKEFLAAIDAELGKTVASFDDWRKKLRALAEAAKAGKHDEVIASGDAIRAMYPDYVEGANAYEFLAEAHLAKGNKPAAMAVLADYAKVGGRNPETLKKLAGMEEEAGDRKAAAAALEKINYIYPVNDEGMHRKLGDLYFSGANYTGAAREYQAAVASKPQDPALAHYNLAKTYAALGRDADVEENLLSALEAAPGYRPAQKLLLELHAKKSQREKK